MPPNVFSDNLGQSNSYFAGNPSNATVSSDTVEITSNAMRKPWKRSKEISRHVKSVGTIHSNAHNLVKKKQKKSNGYRQTGITMSV